MWDRVKYALPVAILSLCTVAATAHIDTAAAYFDTEKTHKETVSCSIVNIQNNWYTGYAHTKYMTISVEWKAFGNEYVDNIDVSTNLKTGKAFESSRVMELYGQFLMGRIGTCYYDLETLQLIDLDQVVWSKSSST